MDDYTWNDLGELVKKIEIDEKVLKTSNLVLFGAGMNGTSAYETLKNDYSVYAFSDNDPQYKNNSFQLYEQLEVVDPEQLGCIDRVFVIITVTGHHYLAIKKQLQDLGIPHLTYAEFILKKNFEKFEIVYHELLADEFSRKTYLSILLSHITCDTNYLKNVFVRNQYFDVPEFYAISANEVFVDCGAYVGDSLERFIENRCGVFNKAYCFEPTKKIFKALYLRRERLLAEWALKEEQIVVVSKLVGARNEVQNFSSSVKEDAANRIVKYEDANGEQVDAVYLDTYFAGREKPTFIKADIEGGEMDLLRGAEGIIRENSPLLAICIYHSFTDLYEIPLAIRELNSKYKMSVRHHMPNYHETVLYCY